MHFYNNYSPRNAWGRLLRALEAPASDRQARQKMLDQVKFHADLNPELFDVFQRQITAEGVQAANGALNLPADLTRNLSGVLRTPFRRLTLDSPPPRPFPFDLALSARLGGQNDISAFHQALPAFAASGSRAPQKILVLYSVSDLAIAERVLAGLARQHGDAQLEILALAPDAPEGFAQKVAKICPGASVLPQGPLHPKTSETVEAALQDVDGVAYLSGLIEMDVAFFDRASQLLRVSDRVVQGIWPLDANGASLTPFAIKSAGAFKQRYPSRELQGLNLLVPSDLIRRAGGLDTRFTAPWLAAKELAWRCYNLGAWFSPLLTTRLETAKTSDPRADKDLYRALCPNSWDRPDDGRYETPKVSIYIPAYNCAKYIENAVGSVLDQDVEDLEVCIAVDGSPDNTMEVLERSFGTDPRVRFADDANGGIGHASNRAIEMTRGLYVGQLDSDDRLTPGAVRRLMTYLDDHPDVACCYGSCERIDEEGAHIKPEYSWPVFSREKMMVTSIAHHFRMFRRAAWERTEKFRSDIINAVDYDIFLKLMDTGRFHHIDEILYQRRWHGENTSIVNEGSQTTNTYRVQREALKRMNLDRFWDVHVPNPDNPRRVTYRRDKTKPRVLFWPDYSRSNPYQHLLYQGISQSHEVIAAPIATAVELIDRTPDSGPVIFHLHWTNFLFLEAKDATTARANAAAFLSDLRYFRDCGGRVIWTMHNLISHEAPYLEAEQDLIRAVIDIADAIHFHSAASVPEMEAHFNIPREKIKIAPHGAYLGVYADHIDRETAREILNIDPEDQVILHTGQVRPYKGVEDLIFAFRKLRNDNPKLRLIIAGEIKYDILAALDTPLTEVEAARITVIDRFLDDAEFQLFYRAADVAAFPYKSILTSGSMLLALSFGVPVVIPSVGMTREVLLDGRGGIAYDAGEPAALGSAIVNILKQGDAAKSAAYQKAQSQIWGGLGRMFSEVLRNR